MLDLLSYHAALLLLFPLLILLFCRLSVIAAKKRAAQSALPPSPPKLPLIGNLHILGRLLHRSLTDLAKVHGPIMLVYFGRIPTFVISSADLAREVMRTHDAVFASRPSMKVSRILFYGDVDMAFSPYGPYWRWTRRICSLHLLSAKRIQSFNSLREKEVARMVDAIMADQSFKGVVNFSKIVYAFSNDVIFRIVFGKLTGDGTRNRMLHEFISENGVLLGQANLNDALPWAAWLGELLGFTKTTRRAEEVHKKWDALLEEVLVEHKEKKRDEGSTEEDFVDVLLSLKEKGEEDDDEGFVLRDENIKALLVDIIAAGMDTTDVVLEWAMAELVKNTESMRKLCDELRSEAKKFGCNNKILGVEELSSMSLPYLNAVIKETLRLHPPAPLLLPRKTTENCTIGGYKIPKGSRVIINAWAIAMDPENWEAPEKFNPDRFMYSDVDFKGNDVQLMPFGVGRRMYPAVLLGSTMIEYALANLMHCFDWKLPPDMDANALDMNELAGLTVRKENNLELVARCMI